MSVDCTNSSSSHPLSIRQNSSTQTLTHPPLPTPYVSRLNSSSTHSHPRMHRGIYSTSSECNPSTTSNVTLNDEPDTKIRFEQETALRNVNASVHFESDASELLPNGLSSLNVVRPSMGGSSTSLRTLSPHPSYYSEDSVDISSSKSEQTVRSPILQKSKLRSVEFSYNRPSLLRQPKVDYSEITCIPDSDEEETGLPDEDLSTIPE